MNAIFHRLEFEMAGLGSCGFHFSNWSGSRSLANHVVVGEKLNWFALPRNARCNPKTRWVAKAFIGVDGNSIGTPDWFVGTAMQNLRCETKHV